MREERSLLFLVASHQGFGEVRLHRQCDELLLRAIVDVALQLPALLILGGNDPLTRSSNLLDQPNVAQDQTRLGGDVGEELVLGRGHRITGCLLYREGAQQLFLVLHGDNARRAGNVDRPGVHQRDAFVRHRRGPRPLSPKLCSNAEPDVGPHRPRALGEHARGPGKDVLDGEGARHPLGELREHLVRCRPLPVDDAVGESLGPVPHGVEGQRDQRRCENREERVLGRSDDRTDADHDRHVHGGDEHSE